MSKQKKYKKLGNGKELLLAILASGKKGVAYDIDLLGRIVYLIDSKAGDKIGGPFFDFKPEAFGPRDESIGDRLNELVEEGFIKHVGDWTYHSYEIKSEGEISGKELLKDLNPRVVNYMQEVVEWAKSCNFWELLGVVLNSDPEMKKKGIIYPGAKSFVCFSGRKSRPLNVVGCFQFQVRFFHSSFSNQIEKPACLAFCPIALNFFSPVFKIRVG